MVAIPPKTEPCPTLSAVNAEMEKRQKSQPRPYLGMSEIGRECEHALWLGFRWASPVKFEAGTLKAFDDGHRSEDIMAERLSLSVNVFGRQIEYKDFGGHLSGHIDGLITGLIQAPVALHVWEHKCTNETKFNKLKKLREQNEKTALEQWDIVYYAQAQLYMHYGNKTRHYLTVCTPGSRDDTAVRTEYNKADAEKYIAKAERIVFAENGCQKISDNETYFACRFCRQSKVCYGHELPQRNCRTCAHVTPYPDGQWHCAKYGVMTTEQQRKGCDKHKFNPAFIKANVVSASDDRVEYDNGFLDA